MQLNHYFDIKRFWLLLKMELYRSRKAILITFVVTFGFLFFMGLLLTPVFEPTMVEFEHASGYAFTLLIGGFILSSLTFHDLSHTLRRFHYLTLPASTFEKFACMWLLTTIGWIVIYTIIYFLYTLVANIIGQFLFSYMTFKSFDPLGKIAVGAVKYYFVIQGIFLVGAVHFKGYVFPKTLFTLILFAMVCGLIAYFFLADVMNPETEECISEPNVLEGTALHRFWMVIVWLFWWVMAPLSWVITYVGLKEKEA